MWTMFWIRVAATIVGGIVLSFMLWVLKQIGWTPAVKLWRLIGKGMSWVRGRLSLVKSRVVESLPHWKNKRLSGEAETLRGEVESLRERVQQLEENAKETRWLELETRRDAYVRICRKLASDIRVTASDGPRVLVKLENDVSDLSTEAQDGYFSLVPSKGKVNANKWIADVELSRCNLRALWG